MTSGRTGGARAKRIGVWGLAGAWLLAAGAAQAAAVDLAVDINPDKAVYTNSDSGQVTVTVANRGQEPASNAQVQVDLSQYLRADLTYASGVSCTASPGATCPGAYTRSAGTGQVNFTVPLLPPGRQVQVVLPAAWFTHITWSDTPVLLLATASPGAGDTELKPATNTAASNISLPAAAPNLAVQVGVPTALPGGDLQYDVVLTNNGNSDAALSLGVKLAGINDFVPASTIDSMSCVAATGGASCASVVAANFGGTSAARIASGPIHPQSLGVTRLPASPGNPSSLTLRYIVKSGVALCSAPAGAARTLTLTATINRLNGLTPDMPFEPPGGGANNTSSQAASSTAPQCATGDLAVSISQPAVAGAGLAPGATHTYTVTYQHNSAGSNPGPAVNARLTGNFVWPIGGGSISSVSCVASGTGAGSTTVCPASFTVSGSGYSGQAPSIAAGGVLTLTVNVTAGADSTRICRPQYALMQADIVPPTSFGDTNYVPGSNPQYKTNTPTKGNNAYQVSTQANIGVTCGPSYDMQVTKLGPFSDAAATIPATNVQPGDWVYFKLSYVNATGSSQLLSYLGRDDLNVYPLGDTSGSGGSFPFSYLQTPLDASAPGGPAERFYFAGRPGDPASLPTIPPMFTPADQPFPSGVRCTASGGATCPDSISAHSAGGGGGYWYMAAWGMAWSGGQPPFPAGGRLDLISSYHVPPLNPPFAGGAKCYVPSQAPSNMWPTVTVRNQFEGYVFESDPMGTDRNPSNDQAQLDFDVKPPQCANTLAVSKTFVAPASTTFIPDDGLVSYELTVSNLSSNNLDLPRLVDYRSTRVTPATVVSVSCNNANNTGGGQCPGFAVPLTNKRNADGSLGALLPLSWGNKTLLDFVWGTAGASTLPAGATVKFIVTLAYPPGTANLGANFAHFTGADSAQSGPWPAVESSIDANLQSSMSATLQKRVDRVVAQRGDSVTFTLDAMNTGTLALTGLSLRDAMPADLAAANPSGFGAVQCRALTSGDGVMTVTTPASCPASLGASASGIATGAFDLPIGSGLRFTFTATSPRASGDSYGNSAWLVEAGNGKVLSGSSANFITPALGWGLGEGAAPIPTLGEWLLAGQAALLALLGGLWLRRRQSAR